MRSISCDLSKKQSHKYLVVLRSGMANRRGEELTHEQWAIISPLIHGPPRREDGRGGPWRDTREIINGVRWVLRSGSRWQDLPDRFPPYQTCHRRFQQWSRDGTLREVLEALTRDLEQRGEIDLSECFIAAPSWWLKGREQLMIIESQKSWLTLSPA